MLKAKLEHILNMINSPRLTSGELFTKSFTKSYLYDE